MTSWVRPGAKVVCAEGTFHNSSGDLPVVGQVYTISWVGTWEWFNATGVGVHLKEVNRTPDVNGVVNPFGLRRFRPLVTKSQDQDIALFTHHLEGVGEDA